MTDDDMTLASAQEFEPSDVPPESAVVSVKGWADYRSILAAAVHAVTLTKAGLVTRTREESDAAITTQECFERAADYFEGVAALLRTAEVRMLISIAVVATEERSGGRE